ncbi:peptidase C15 [Enterovirga rhinocerotis]|uniref:Pyroglutamyl-peptidase I n=1 Tax=Enterovirga rhinocerotis TaxID=1339210 RepID=A0A4R7C6N3_9HYPH|nr:peptidase C15 [Enterovirga rhinocerotis]TDR93921.1 pyroglutamyl-peptidase [Enterovirga rhinocerotis]
MRLLVAGFGPFPTMPRNPSAALARAVAASPRLKLHGIAPLCRILTTAYATLPGELDPRLADRPDIVLLIGVAARTPWVRIETRATSRRSTLFPDVAGETAAPVGGVRRTAEARRTRAGTLGALHSVRRRGLPVRLSRDAGRYLCNAAYFRALGQHAAALFVHIPREPRLRAARPGRSRRPGRAEWNARLRAALVDVVLAMAVAARRDDRSAAL